MEKARSQCAPLRYFWIATLFFLVLSVSERNASAQRPFSVGQVIGLLEKKVVSESEIIGQIERYKVNFELTKENTRALIKAGASDKLLDAIEKNSPKAPIEILQVVPAGRAGQPQTFNVKGTATIPSGIQQDDVAVMIYTKSGEGGEIQLQMRGPENNKEPRIAAWKPDTNEWEVTGVWLGTKEMNDGSYEVYAVAIQNFNTSDNKKLIDLTHGKYTKFKEDIFERLRKEGFNPLAWKRRIVSREN